MQHPQLLALLALQLAPMVSANPTVVLAPAALAPMEIAAATHADAQPAPAAALMETAAEVIPAPVGAAPQMLPALTVPLVIVAAQPALSQSGHLHLSTR